MATSANYALGSAPLEGCQLPTLRNDKGKNPVPSSSFEGTISDSLDVSADLVERTYSKARQVLGTVSETTFFQGTGENLPFIVIPHNRAETKENDPANSIKKFGDSLLRPVADKAYSAQPQTGNIHPTLILIGTELGQGRCATVYKGYDTDIGECAVKISKCDEKCYRSLSKTLEHEYRILRQIHKNGKLEGIQLAPYKIVKIVDNEGVKIVVIEPAYDSDLDNANHRIKETNQTRVKQLTRGLSTLDELSIFHGDIKEENIFVKKGRCDLADFGDVRSYAKVKESYDQFFPLKKEDPKRSEKASTIFGIHSARYVALDDKIAFFSSLEKGGDWSTCEQILRKRDIYALGMTLLNTYCDNYDLCPDFLSLFRDKGCIPRKLHPLLQSKGFTEQQILMIERMINKDYTKRPTAKEVAAVF